MSFKIIFHIFIDYFYSPFTKPSFERFPVSLAKTKWTKQPAEERLVAMETLCEITVLVPDFSPSSNYPHQEAQEERPSSPCGALWLPLQPEPDERGVCLQMEDMWDTVCTKEERGREASTAALYLGLVPPLIVLSITLLFQHTRPGRESCHLTYTGVRQQKS